MKNLKNIVCAISGGVDSCVAALLLKKQGYRVQGVFMRNWDIADEAGHCQADQDKEDANYVCQKLGIPLVEVNFVKTFWNNVFSDFIYEYKKGWTPNPDILCNKRIKFDIFLKYAQEKWQVDVVATGHYARIEKVNETDFRLLKGVDESKDQSLFLSQIPRDALKTCIFPVGNMMKCDVKDIAFKEGFGKIASKKESTGICFIGRRNFQTFIDEYIEPQPGNFINIEDGAVVGEHKGVHCWTVGQRCLIGGQRKAFFVAERDFKTQDILVAPGSTHPALFSKSVITESPYWVTPEPPKLENGQSFECDFRFQHLKPLVRCFLYKDNSGLLHVLLKKPLKALTPGQFAVFYQGDECLGSARILSKGPSLYDLSRTIILNDTIFKEDTMTVKKCCRT